MRSRSETVGQGPKDCQPLPDAGVGERWTVFWESGFRPFYLLASTFATLSIGLWAAQFYGLLKRPYLAEPHWHAHEMLFGFTLCVVVGFLFTAGRNWSMQPTPTGFVLAALAALWVAGRVLVLTPFGWVAATVNAAFPFAAAIGLAVPLWRGRNRRNYFFVGLLTAMGMASLAFHLSLLSALNVPARTSLNITLDLVLFTMVVMGGRVIPMFTNNGVPGAGATSRPWMERAALTAVLCLLVADLLEVRGGILIALALLGAAAHMMRWVMWRPWKTLRAPLVWVLHIAYAWIPVHLALRGASELGWVSGSAAVHALTVGAIGGLTIGMMTRTARGHTGRLLRADGFDVACYAFVFCAALVRVLLPVAVPASFEQAVLASGGFWCAGFALYSVRYWPVLTRPRLDGKSG